MRHTPTTLERYAVAVALVAGAFALRYVLYGSLDNRLPFAFFTPATIVAAWYGGLGPGLVAAAAGLLLGDYFFLPPHSAWGPLGEAERTIIGTYAVSNSLIVLLFGHLHARLRDLEDDLRKLKSQDQEHQTKTAPETADRSSTPGETLRHMNPF